MRAVHLANDAKAAPGADLAPLIDQAAQARDLHHLAIPDREIRARSWPLTDPSRIAAKVAMSHALDSIDEIAPDRAQEVSLIEEAGKAFSDADTYLHAVTFGGEPMALQMRRSNERIAAMQAQSASQSQSTD